MSAVEDRLSRARRQRARGDARKALMLLREASCLCEADARVWTLYGMQAWRMGRRSDAQQALKQALWLRERAKDHARAGVLRRLLLAVESAGAPNIVNAA